MYKKTKLAVVDRQELFRKGIISVLELSHDFEIISDSVSHKGFITSLQKQLPDIVLLGMNLEDINAVEVILHLQQYYSGIKILLFTIPEDDFAVLNLLNKGINGVLSRHTSAEKMKEAIFSIINEGYYFNEILNTAYNCRYRLKQELAAILSPRETEIARLLCEDMSCTEIADNLCLSLRTVQGHREQILKKTKCKSIASLLLFALKYNLSDKLGMELTHIRKSINKG